MNRTGSAPFAANSCGMDWSGLVRWAVAGCWAACVVVGWVGLPGWSEGLSWWWVGPGGAGDVDLAVGDGDGPVAVVQVDVVAAAQQAQVVHGGGAAVDPGLQVVGVALHRRRTAHDAAFVAGVQGAAHRAGDEPLGPPDIQRLRPDPAPAE